MDRSNAVVLERLGDEWHKIYKSSITEAVTSAVEFGVPFLCTRTSGRWSVEMDNSNGSAVQPQWRFIQRLTYELRTVVSVRQVRANLNFYLSTGHSNPGINFANTFFRNGENRLTYQLVTKCTPKGTWFEDLLKSCCVGETLSMQFLDGVGEDIRRLYGLSRDETVLDVCVVDDIKYAVPPYGRKTAKVAIRPRDASAGVRHLNGPYEDGWYYMDQLWSFDYRWTSCRSFDLLMVPILNKFCTWRDAQISSCMGGLWDVDARYVGTAHNDPATLINFGALDNVKFLLQHYDYDPAARQFVERPQPLVDLAPHHKMQLREGSFD